jgi:hypothetical protein
MIGIVGFYEIFAFLWFTAIFYNTTWLNYLDERELKRQELLQQDLEKNLKKQN